MDKLRETYRSEVSEGRTAIELNVDSLLAYIETSSHIDYWIDTLNRSQVITIERESSNSLPTIINVAEFCGITSLEQLDAVMLEAREWGESFLSRYYRDFISFDPDDVEGIFVYADVFLVDLIIAAHAEKFTRVLLEFRVRWDPDILNFALEARGLA